jgi:hypothetical protein
MALRDDIAAHGQRDPIALLGGQILDGRNRYRACRELGIKPQSREWDGKGSSPVALVLSANLHRRHLTSSQRAAAADDHPLQSRPSSPGGVHLGKIG